MRNETPTVADDGLSVDGSLDTTTGSSPTDTNSEAPLVYALVSSTEQRVPLPVVHKKKSTRRYNSSSYYGMSLIFGLFASPGKKRLFWLKERKKEREALE